jgi:hypothetical protein
MSFLPFKLCTNSVTVELQSKTAHLARPVGMRMECAPNSKRSDRYNPPMMGRPLNVAIS